MASKKVEAAIWRLKCIRRNHPPRVVYGAAAKKVLSYEELDKRIRDDERVALSWYLKNDIEGGQNGNRL